MSVSIADPARDVPATQTGMTGPRFVVWMLLATLLPMPLIALAGGSTGSGAEAGLAYAGFVYVSTAHVGLSGLFWLDRRYRGHINANPRAYYGVIALVAAYCAVGTALLGAGFVYAVALVFMGWNALHYARQNWGVLILAARGLGAPAPTWLERQLCHAAALGGLIGLLPNVLPLDLLPDGLITTGLLISWGTAGASCVVAGQLALAGAPALRVMLTVVMGSFFLPIHLVGPVVGFTMVAGAHASQYYVMMTILAADRKQGSPVWRIGGMLAISALLIGVLRIVQVPEFAGLNLSKEVQVMVVTVTVVWHFLLDAGLWRLSQPFQRQAVRESFEFLHAAGAARQAVQE